MATILTHPEYLATDFGDWIAICEQKDNTREFPADGNLGVLITIWMQDQGAAKSATYDAFLRAVVLIVAAAAAGEISYRLAEETGLTTATIPMDAGDWWMLEPMEFEAARPGSHATR